MRNKLRALTGVTALFAVVASLFVAPSANAYVLNSADFNAGNIISDAQFFDENAMTEAEIQQFLNMKIGTCAAGNPYCLNIYRQDTWTRPASVIDVSNGVPLCAQYTGATGESAARIIYKVQKACHISAKVLLVTLQKEQGLITATAPTEGKLKIAMGYGCPDTAPCDAQYFGFYNQVYKAASQLNRYTNPASSFYRSKPVGATSAIAWHPNSACGATNVYISNRATHALYIYTPYTPNAASLGNLWGTGDACSSYGNRNFWRNYNSWFNLKAELFSQVAAMAPATKTLLGSVVSDTGCSELTNSCSVTYQSGVVTFTMFGALTVTLGPIGSAYQAAGGPSGSLGAIVGSQETIVASGTGYRQKFANGYIYQTPSGSTFIVSNAINDFYVAQGGPAGSLGWPKSAARCVTPKCDQAFDAGVIITNSVNSFTVVPGVTGAALTAAGGVNATWGLPTAARQAVTTTSFGNGFKQTFQNGTAYEKGTSAVFVPTVLNSAFIAVGGQATLGWPLVAAASSGTNQYQQFNAGYLFGSSANTTGILVPTAMSSVWATAGGASSYLGFPTAAAQTVTDSRSASGSVITFSGGAIISSAAGTFAQPTLIRTKYLAAGGQSGTYGWPTANATLSGTTWTQNFQGGTLTSAVPVVATSRPTLRVGSRGADVVYLQQKLRITADGIFGNGTKTAVINFQRSRGLTADGIVGPKTWAALG